MSLYYLILWNQVDILQKHFKKDHVHMRLWTRFYGTCTWLRKKKIGLFPELFFIYLHKIHKMIDFTTAWAKRNNLTMNGSRKHFQCHVRRHLT